MHPRAGTIRRLSPTIVADCFRFNESIPDHEKSILVATVNLGKMPCYCRVKQSNQVPFIALLQCQCCINQLNPLNCNSQLCLNFLWHFLPQTFDNCNFNWLWRALLAGVILNCTLTIQSSPYYLKVFFCFINFLWSHVMHWIWSGIDILSITYMCSNLI